MRTSSIGREDLSAISDLLEEVAELTEPGSEVGAAATYWAQTVWSGLREDELQTVAWLLRDGDGHSRLPAADRALADRWATWLEDTAGDAAVRRARQASGRRQSRWLRVRRA